MQTVWSRSLRLQSTCRCISCTNSIPSVLSRRSTTGIARKKLTVGDAFTLLLGPVLGGVYIVDTKAKETRRREWDEKIAAVQAEVEQMRRNEVKTYHIRSRNLRRLPSLNRGYRTAAAASFDLADEEDSIHAVDWSDTNRDESQEQPWIPNTNDAVPGPGEDPIEPQIVPKLDSAAVEKCKRLQRLVAIKLAIRMILHIHIGKSPRYVLTSSDYAYDQGRLPQNANELIRHLKQVSSTLKLMNSDELRASWRAYQSLTRGQTCSLDIEIRLLARQFREAEINVTQLVEQFAEKLLSSSESPTVHGYIPFLRVLSRARFEELCFMVDGTMMESRLSYDRYAIFSLLWQYGKNKEARYFEKLIKKLTTDSANAQFGEQWLWRNIGGTLVPVPPSQDPQILQILVYTALKCNQPHRAEAWARILAHQRDGHWWLSHVIRNFLKYYSAHKSWSRGLVWLKTASDRAELLAAQGIRHVQRIAFAMLEFCVAHDKRDLYRGILEAAVDCRLGVYAADPDLTLTQRSADILREWELCHTSGSAVSETSSPLEKAQMFVRQLEQAHDFEVEDIAGNSHTAGFLGYKGLPRVETVYRRPVGFGQELETQGDHHEGTMPVSETPKDKAEVDHWKELCRTQQEQLDLLKRQLDSLKSESKSESVLSRGGQEVHSADAVRATTERPDNTMVHAAAPDFQVAPLDDGVEGASTKPAIVPWRLLSPPDNPVVIPTHPFSNDFLDFPSQDRDQPHPTSTASPEGKKDFLQPTTNPYPQRSYTSVLNTNSLPVSLPSHPNPTLPELYRALDLCTCITNSLRTHILDSPRIQPLYALVSTVPLDLLISILMDGTWTHLVRSMTTEWEQKVYWDKLMLEVRRRRKQELTPSAAEVEEAKAEEEGGGGGDEPPPPPLAHKQKVDSKSRKRGIGRVLEPRKDELPVRKAGYGALRLQV